MPDAQMYEFDPETLELIAQFIFRTIKPDLFHLDGDRPMPEEEIRAALERGGGYIKVRKDDGVYLILAHRNGRLLLYTARRRAVIHNATTVAGLWDDSATIDQHRRLYGLSEIGLLVELDEQSWADSLDGLCLYRSPNKVAVTDDAPRVKVTVLDLKRIHVNTFIEGLTAAVVLEPAA